jgi:hypothetical protein
MIKITYFLLLLSIITIGSHCPEARGAGHKSSTKIPDKIMHTKLRRERPIGNIARSKQNCAEISCSRQNALCMGVAFATCYTLGILLALRSTMPTTTTL